MQAVSIIVPCCACAVGSWLAEELDVGIAGVDEKGTAASCIPGQGLDVRQTLSP